MAIHFAVSNNPEETSEEICIEISHFNGESQTLCDSHQGPRDFFYALIERHALRDAVTFLAHAVPHKHSVWWACRGLSKMCGAKLGESPNDVIDLAERWLNDSNPAYLAAACAAAEKVGLDQPAGCLGIALWSESERAPEEMPGFPPKGNRLPGMVAKALLLSVVTDENGEMIKDVERINSRFKELLTIGVAIAEGQDVCPGQE